MIFWDLGGVATKRRQDAKPTTTKRTANPPTNAAFHQRRSAFGTALSAGAGSLYCGVCRFANRDIRCELVPLLSNGDDQAGKKRNTASRHCKPNARRQSPTGDSLCGPGAGGRGV